MIFNNPYILKDERLHKVSGPDDHERGGLQVRQEEDCQDRH